MVHNTTQQSEKLAPTVSFSDSKANLVTNTKHKFPHALWSKDVFISLAYVRCQTSMLDMDCLVEQNLA